MNHSQHSNLNPSTNLSGSLLLAHPSLKDPNFAQSVILISSHSPKDGALGVIINRPLETVLGELDFVVPPYMETIPISGGGPVDANKIIFAAWEWLENERFFQLFFGLSLPELDDMIQQDKDLVAKGFLGHAAWLPGQLETEIQAGAWVSVQVDRKLIETYSGKELWKKLLYVQLPELKIILDVPEDPSVN